MATRKARTALTTLGVTLGVAVILATAIANQSTVDSFRDMVDAITGEADFWVGGASGAGFRSSVLDDVRDAPGVDVAVPGISRGSTIYVRKGRQAVQVGGVDTRVDRRLRRYDFDSGRWLKRGEFGMLMTERLARENKVGLGDKIALAGARRRFDFRLVGILKEEGAGRFMGGKVVFIPLEAARDVFGMAGRLTYVDVKAKPGQPVGRVVDSVKRRLGGGFIVEQPEQRAEAIAEMLRGLQVGMSFFGTIAMFVGGFLVYNTFGMVVIEQTQELGVLRALGAGRGQVTRFVLAQAAVIGLIGSTIGVGAGILLSRFLLGFVSENVQMPIEALSVPPVALGTAVAVGLAVTLVAALHPAFMAGRISPLAAIRIRAAAVSGRATVVRVAFGIFGVAVGVAASFLPNAEELGRYAYLAVPIHEVGNFMLFLGAALLSPSLAGPLSVILSWPIKLVFGATGKLAAENLRRSRGRTAATASAVMITLAMLMAVGGMTTSFRESVDRWVDKSLGADIFVSGHGAETSFSKDFADKLRKVKGVADLTMVRFISVREGDRQLLFRAIEPKSYRRFASLQLTEGKKEDAWRKLSKGGYVFLSNVAANKRKLGVGDKLTLTTAKGPKDFEVAAVNVEFSESGDLVVGSRRDLKRYFELDDATGFRLKTANGASPKATAKRINRRFKKMDLDVQDINEFKNTVQGRVDSSFAVFNVLILLAAIVAMISVFNTLMINILERRREIGVLRATGATRGQIALMTLLEALLTGGIGGLLGLGVGWFSANDIVSGMNALTGYEISFVFPVRITVVAVIIALVFSVLAAVYPARKAATLEISRALQYE